MGGVPVGGDDALEAGFVDLEEARALVPWSETERIIRAATERFGCLGA